MTPIAYVMRICYIRLEKNSYNFDREYKPSLRALFSYFYDYMLNGTLYDSFSNLFVKY